MDFAELKTAIDDHQVATTEVLQQTTKDLKATRDELFNARAQIDQIETRLNRPGAASMHRGDRGDTAGEHKSVGAFCKRGAEIKSVDALSVGSDVGGGYVTLPHFAATIIKRIFDLSPIRRLARVQTIPSGDSWVEPLDLDTAAAEWVGERQARPALAAPELGLLTVPVNEIYSNVAITQKLLDLAAIDVGSWVQGKLADRFARAEGLSYVSGDGVGQPEGFLNLPTSTDGDSTRARATLQYVPSGAAQAITADGLGDLYWTVRAPHRGSAVWVMSSATANAVDKLKSGTGDYLWRDSSTAGVPPMLLGRHVEFDENMPAVSGGNYPIAFGDFSAGYLIVDHAGLKFLRDPYSDKPLVHVYCYRRTGGGVALTDAIKLLKIGTS